MIVGEGLLRYGPGESLILSGRLDSCIIECESRPRNFLRKKDERKVRFFFELLSLSMPFFEFLAFE